jgi:hypothetical protein
LIDHSTKEIHAVKRNVPALTWTLANSLLVLNIVTLVLCVGIVGCGIGKKAHLTLQSPPSSVQAGTQVVFTALITNGNGGANWALTSSGTACAPACGTLSNSTNNGGTATITYSAPNPPPSPAQVTITATSVDNPKSMGSDTFTVTSAP